MSPDIRRSKSRDRRKGFNNPPESFFASEPHSRHHTDLSLESETSSSSSKLERACLSLEGEASLELDLLAEAFFLFVSLFFPPRSQYTTPVSPHACFLNPQHLNTYPPKCSTACEYATINSGVWNTRNGSLMCFIDFNPFVRPGSNVICQVFSTETIHCSISSSSSTLTLSASVWP